VVLIVERDPVLRRALYDGLGAAGYRGVTACDRLHAEAVLHDIEQDLSLALVDDESWPLTPSARAALQQRWPTLPIVVMLESANLALEQRAHRHGATEVLTKPFDLPAVVSLADRLTGSHNHVTRHDSRCRRRTVDPVVARGTPASRGL
jgi:DNA-binding NtrC family response regulator